MERRYVARPRPGMLAQLSRYRGEVADRTAEATLETTSLRVAITIAELLEADDAGVLDGGHAAREGDGRYEHFLKDDWTLVLYLRGSDAEEVARSRDAGLAAYAARLLQAHTPEPPKGKRPSLWRLPVGNS
jgi:hypothetical protein